MLLSRRRFLGFILMTILSGRVWLGSRRRFRPTSFLPTVVAFQTAAPYQHINNNNNLVEGHFWFPPESTAKRGIHTGQSISSVLTGRRRQLQHNNVISSRRGGNERFCGLSASSTASATADVASWKKDLNDAQIEAVTKPLYSVTRVIAGPGSGKTRCVFVFVIVWIIS